MSEELKFRPLHLVERLVEGMKTAITYVYDDFIFVEHSEVLLQFDDKEELMLNFYISDGVTAQDRMKIKELWEKIAVSKDIRLNDQGGFSIEQVAGKDEVTIRFS